ncbi:MAG: MFS transporter [Methyloligellaceae bacterium]
MGFRQSLGLFLSPITAEQGLGREAFALAMGLMNLVWGLASPFAGAVADRFGAGRVAAMGGAFYGAGLLALGWTGDGTQLHIGGILIGLGLSGSGFTVILGAVGRAVPEEKRSAALGLVSMGGSIGQFAALPYTHLLIEGFGWIWSLGFLALTALLIVPLSRGIAGRPREVPGRAVLSMRAALREACAIRSFWLLNAGFFVCGFHLAFVAVHLPAFLEDRGFEPWLAAAALTVIGITNIAGSYGFGLLGGWYQKKNVLSGLYLARALIFLGFVAAPVTEASVLVFSAVIGLTWLGTVPLTSGLVGHIFGTTYMSMLFGIVFVGHQFGGFLGAWLAGYAYDAFGSYDAMWTLSIALGVLSALLHWPIEERPLPRLAIGQSGA